MGKKESYNAFFPKKEFLEKLYAPVPSWMNKQMERDFREISPFTAEKLQKGYLIMAERVKDPIFLYHYRILDGELFRYVLPGTPLSCRDNHYEKALKTLLSHTTLPDLDFVLCPMDGIPETIVPQDFFLLEDPSDQIPVLGQAKLREPKTRFIILIPDQLSLAHDWYGTAHEILSLNETIPWEEMEDKAFWRGGVSDRRGFNSPRFLLCCLSKQHPDTIDAASTYTPELMEKVQKEGLPILSGWIGKKEHLACKYQPTLDGNMCTYPGYQWRLLSNAVPFKQESEQIQWFYDALEPYVHYIPVKNDMSDLLEKMAWAKENEPLAKQIAQNGQRFAKEYLLYEDCYRYLTLVLEKYATYQEIDFVQLKKETLADPNWVNIQYRNRLTVSKRIAHVFERGKKLLGR